MHPIENLIQDWQRHNTTTKVQFSSDPDAGNRCDAYRMLVQRGPAVLPYLREHWDDSSISEHIRLFGFTRLFLDVKEGSITVPEDLRGRMREMHRYLGNRLREE